MKQNVSIDEKCVFTELESDLIADYSIYLSEVECGNLMDFDPEWVLETFMQENFGSTDAPDSYKDDKKAMLFYRELGLKWCDAYAEKQEKILNKITQWGTALQGLRPS